MNTPLGRSRLSVKAQGSAPEMRRNQANRCVVESGDVMSSLRGPSPGLRVRELPRGSSGERVVVSVKGGNAGMQPRTMGKPVDET